MVDLYWHSLSFAHSHEYIYDNKKDHKKHSQAILVTGYLY